MNYLKTMDDEFFSRGMSVDTYASKTLAYRSIVKKLLPKPVSNTEHVERLISAAGSQKWRATAMSEDWCGDWVCNIGILNRFFADCNIEFRVFRGSEERELKERYEKDGDDHIPVVSIWNEDGEELARWIEAPKAVSVKKNHWQSEHPEYMETYNLRETDPEADKQFARIYRDFIGIMSSWYENTMWEETTREIVELCEKK